MYLQNSISGEHASYNRTEPDKYGIGKPTKTISIFCWTTQQQLVIYLQSS